MFDSMEHSFSKDIFSGHSMEHILSLTTLGKKFLMYTHILEYCFLLEQIILYTMLYFIIFLVTYPHKLYYITV